MLSATLSGYALAHLTLSQKARQQAREIEQLSEHNRALEHDLYQQRAELVRVSALAEARSEELWNLLQQRQAELAQLWQQLGQDRRRHARPTLAARGARSLRRLGLQRQFNELQAQVAASMAESERLKLAAQAQQQARQAEERMRRQRATPSGPPCSGEMTSPFGLRTHPIYGSGRLHRGCDYTTPEGTLIRATADGTVVTSDWLGGYGQVVEIDHGYGLRTLYAHCSQLQVSKGQKVQRGQGIARVGMTGLASGPHCHYEVHLHGEAVDPKSYLPATAPRPPRAMGLWQWLPVVSGSE
jgi:murein DD-endopeptidase MepM/ murein hydrolase activator NlpD